MRQVFTGLLALCVIAAFFLGYASNVSIRTATPTPLLMVSVSPSAAATINPAPVDAIFAVVKMKLPAVDKEGNGALADLAIETKTGLGRVYIGFEESPLINSDTQSSLRIALDVAKRYVQADAKNVDVYYTFSTKSDVVGGKSAGAAATVGTIAALKKAPLRRDVLITGTVEADGSIGQVGKVLEKAKVVKLAGFTTFLVPPGESMQSVVIEECTEKKTQSTYAKECTSSVKRVDIAKEVGISIIEVKNVAEAYEHFKTA